MVLTNRSNKQNNTINKLPYCELNTPIESICETYLAFQNCLLDYGPE